jgi:hypothetical protein
MESPLHPAFALFADYIVAARLALENAAGVASSDLLRPDFNFAALRQNLDEVAIAARAGLIFKAKRIHLALRVSPKNRKREEAARLSLKQRTNSHDFHAKGGRSKSAAKCAANKLNAQRPRPGRRSGGTRRAMEKAANPADNFAAGNLTDGQAIPGF